VVVARSGWNLPESGDAANLLKAHHGDIKSLHYAAAGSIVLQAPCLLPISATEIRKQIHAGESAQFLVPSEVWNYICAQNLYR
jgi:nicotinate-nucleotide adenylyltransferase